MAKNEVPQLNADDLVKIVDALNRGSDVRIQNTPEGYRIVEDKVHVLKKVKLWEKGTKGES